MRTTTAGHYADAGEAALLMSATLDVHTVVTGHSLGRNKLEHLLASGTHVDLPGAGGGPGGGAVRRAQLQWGQRGCLVQFSREADSLMCSLQLDPKRQHLSERALLTQ